MSDILNKKEVDTLTGMAVYWRELLERDESVRNHILAGELGQVIYLLGPEKVLRIIMAYVNRVNDEETK